MAIFKALTFDGVNSLDYGIYITGEAVYNAPERAVEMVNIPGKNGALALDQGRFENIEVTYHAGCFADNQADFADKVMKFRNALASRYTYKRLTDEYHPDEYRLGLYKSGLEVDAVRYSTAGEFNITFDCKPQRFLVDGDRAISPTEWSDVQTESGELVTIESDGSLAVRSLEVSLSPIQAGSGTPSPDNVRPISGRTEVVTHRTGKNLIDAVSGSNNLVVGSIRAGETYTFSVRNRGVCGFNLKKNDNSGEVIIAKPRSASSVVAATFTADEDCSLFLNGFCGNGYTFADSAYNYQLELGTTATAYEPYNGNTYTTALGRTVYGGTLDVVSGVLTVDRAMVDLGTLTWVKRNTSSGHYRFTAEVDVYHPSSSAVVPNLVCSIYPTITPADSWLGVQGISCNLSASQILVSDENYADATAFKTAMNGAQLVYELATPQTYQLTPQQIGLLLGENHLWSDGEITVTYGVHPYYNPTPFESKPLIKVTGTGTLGIGEYILTITGTASQTLYIDCETMEIYTIEGTVPTGASSLVSINKNDFPVLEPGTNYISVGSGITAVTITPRWWRI